jgi:hypothetical protein
MSLANYSIMNAEEAAKSALQMNAQSLHSEIKFMNVDQISSVLSILNESCDSNWREKTRAAIFGISDKPKLEAAGKVLTLNQILEFLEEISNNSNEQRWKLSPLLVGLSHNVFSQLLVTASRNQVQILKHESFTEPVQHHLTILSHELNAFLYDLNTELEAFEQHLQTLNLSEITSDEIAKIINGIDYFFEKHLGVLNKANKALAIAWNTNRADIIEGLNVIKEKCQKVLTYRIGKKDSIDTKDGLHTLLIEHLNQIYGNPSDPHNVEALQAGEPAIEAIAKFSIWYLEDYWEIGLFPHIKERKEIETLESKDDINSNNIKEKLFKSAQQNLKNLGLFTVEDLKRSYIYSKKGLKEFILKNQNLIE